MRYAVLSDIHSNRQAWSAIRKDIEKQGVDAILCLGDVIGYGPSPVEVLESVNNTADEMVLGNHDAVICGRFDIDYCSATARHVLEWTADQLSDEVADFFSDLPSELVGEDFLAIHAEVADPERFDYIEDEDTAREAFEACGERIIFVGHTHIPNVFVLDQESGDIDLFEPQDFAIDDASRYIVNVGSVGNPGGPELVKGCYCIYDLEAATIRYREIPFDIREFRDDLAKSGLPLPYFLEAYDSEKDFHASQAHAVRVMRKGSKPVVKVARGMIGAERLNRHDPLHAKRTADGLAADVDAESENARRNMESEEEADQGPSSGVIKGLQAKHWVALLVLAGILLAVVIAVIAISVGSKEKKVAEPGKYFIPGQGDVEASDP